MQLASWWPPVQFSVSFLSYAKTRGHQTAVTRRKTVESGLFEVLCERKMNEKWTDKNSQLTLASRTQVY